MSANAELSSRERRVVDVETADRGGTDEAQRRDAASSDTAARGRLVNAMSVDVEDYFQVSAFADRVDRAAWDDHPCRVEGNVDRILALFADNRVSATFFTLGWVAERYPAMVRRIVEAGHELASHGLEHVQVFRQTPEVFRADVREAKKRLEDIGGAEVVGYRAASFSIDRRAHWAFEILAEEGHRYSSSIYPIRHDHYGVPDAPRFRFRPEGAGDLTELPVSTMRLFGHNLPSGGGGYFRLLPYRLSRWSLRRINRGEGEPCIFYFHPWEIDPDQPRFTQIPFKTRVRHYIGLGRMELRLKRLVRDLAWDRIDRVFEIRAPR